MDTSVLIQALSVGIPLIILTVQIDKKKAKKGVAS